MINCPYCDRPLICAACQSPYVPPTQDHYEALSRPELPLECPACEAPLVCHWCKTAYDGQADETEES